MTTTRISAWMAVGGWLWLAFAGCASLKDHESQVPDVKPVRQKRAEEVAKRYEQHRDAAQYSAAVACLNQHNSSGCRELLEKILDRNPEHRESGLLLTEVLLVDGDVKRAREQVERLAALYPSDAEVLHTQGLVEEAAGDDTSAAEHFQQALVLEPSNEIFAASWQAVEEPAQPVSHRRAQPLSQDIDIHAQMWKAELRLALDEVDEALALLDEVLQQEPSQAEAEHMTGRALQHVGQGPQAADHYRRAAQLDPDCSVYQLTAADAMKNWPAAKQSSSHDPNEIASLASATRVTKQFDPPSAKPGSHDSDRNESAGRASPFAASEWLDRGTVALSADAPASALSYFQRARCAAPRDEGIATSAAMLLLRNEQPELAVRFVQEALHDLPDSAALHRINGAACYRLGQWKAAQVALQQALSLDKSQPLSYFLMGSTLRKLGKPEEAETYFRQARQLDPRYAAETPSSSSR